jgi:hypothetical protein
VKRIEKEFNALTGEETITEREETAQEKTNRETWELEVAQNKAEDEAKALAKIAAESKLAALGLTTDDLRALGL